MNDPFGTNSHIFINIQTMNCKLCSTRIIKKWNLKEAHKKQAQQQTKSYSSFLINSDKHHPDEKRSKMA